MLGITPDQYWKLTPAELGEMLEGYSWRQERVWDVAAWVTSHMINISGKTTRKKITPDKLLGRKKQAMRNVTYDDKVKSFEEILRRQAQLDGRIED